MTRPLQAFWNDRIHGWDMTDHESFQHFRVLVRQIPQDAIEQDFDGVDRGSIDLHVVHVALRRHPGAFEFVDQLIADRFEAGSRFFTAEHTNRCGKLLGGESEPSDAAGEVLNSFGVRHLSITPHKDRLAIKARWEANRLARACAYAARDEAREAAA